MALSQKPGEDSISTIMDIFPNITDKDIKYIKKHMVSCSNSTMQISGRYNCPNCTIKCIERHEGTDYVSGDEIIKYYHPKGLKEEDITDDDLINYIKTKAKDISILQGKYSDGLVENIRNYIKKLVA